MTMKNENDTDSNHDAAKRDEVAGLVQGDQVRGVVRRVTDFGVFVEVAPGVNGLLHIGDLSWQRIRDTAGIFRHVRLDEEIDVKILRVDLENGRVSLGRKQLTPDPWPEMKEAHANGKPVEGVVQERVRGGFVVVLNNGLSAFLPASRASVLPAIALSWEGDSPNAHPLVGTRQKFKIAKIDHCDIFVDRRAVEEKTGFGADLVKGRRMRGVVRHIAKYGAFVEIAPAICGLLHLNDMTWRRVSDPNAVVKVGDEVEVVILEFSMERRRLSLGMKQLTPDPWDNAERNYPVGCRVRGTVGRIKDYGAFVDIGGIEGLLHSSEMPPMPEGISHADVLYMGQEIEVAVIAIDQERRRISLSMKACLPK